MQRLMALKDLSISLTKHHIQNTPQNVSITSADAEIACDVVDHIFKSIDICLKENKSKYQVSLFARSFIRGILTDNVKGGISSFIKNMNDEDVGALLDDMQKELDKRKIT